MKFSYFLIMDGTLVSQETEIQPVKLGGEITDNVFPRWMKNAWELTKSPSAMHDIFILRYQAKAFPNDILHKESNCHSL